MGKHTPGPWERRVNSGNSVIRIEPASERGHAVVAYVTRSTMKAIFENRAPVDENSENWANARLIAASPDLLEACKRTLDMLETIEAKTLVGDEGCLWGVELVRAAIAKAEGNTP